MSEPYHAGVVLSGAAVQGSEGSPGRELSGEIPRPAGENAGLRDDAATMGWCCSGPAAHSK